MQCKLPRQGASPLMLPEREPSDFLGGTEAGTHVTECSFHLGQAASKPYKAFPIPAHPGSPRDPRVCVVGNQGWLWASFLLLGEGAEGPVSPHID